MYCVRVIKSAHCIIRSSDRPETRLEIVVIMLIIIIITIAVVVKNIATSDFIIVSIKKKINEKKSSERY